MRKSLLVDCSGLWTPFSLLQKLVGGLYRFLGSISPMAMHEEGLQRFVVSVFTVVKLVTRFWKFVDSVFCTKKHM